MKMYYMRCKTTMGRRYRMREPHDARLERILFRSAVVGMTFIGSAGMFLLWVKGV